MKLNKTSLIILLSFFYIFSSCTKEETEPEHIFKRGQVLSSNLTISFTSQQVKALFESVGLTGGVNYEYDVDLYSLKYETISALGEETYASGLLIIPKNTNGALPLVNYHHGTILNTNAVPSKNIFGSGFEVGLMFGVEGYAICVPDYLGLGDSEGLHPYMHAKSEATSSIDMLRAAKNQCSEIGVELNEQLFLLGYSQGGHAAMATQKEIETNYSNEFAITANAPLAGPYDVSGIMAELIFKKESYITPGFLPYMLYSYNSVYNLYADVSDVLISPYNENLPLFFDGNSTETLTDVNLQMPAIPSDILTNEEYLNIQNKTNTKFWDALKDNDLYDWTPLAPIQMCHCDGDETVPFANSEKALNYFIAEGVSNATLINPFPSGTHRSCFIPSILATKEWFATMKK